jgi:hypothetical protein
MKVYHLWPKNDDEKWCRKMFLKFLHVQAIFKHFFLFHRREDFCTKFYLISYVLFFSYSNLVEINKTILSRFWGNFVSIEKEGGKRKEEGRIFDPRSVSASSLHLKKSFLKKDNLL